MKKIVALLLVLVMAFGCSSALAITAFEYVENNIGEVNPKLTQNDESLNNRSVYFWYTAEKAMLQFDFDYNTYIVSLDVVDGLYEKIVPKVVYFMNEYHWDGQVFVDAIESIDTPVVYAAGAFGDANCDSAYEVYDAIIETTGVAAEYKIWD